jgi:hypothetical protein
VGGRVSLRENLFVGGVGLRWPLSKVRRVHRPDDFFLFPCPTLAWHSSIKDGRHPSHAPPTWPDPLSDSLGPSTLNGLSNHFYFVIGRFSTRDEEQPGAIESESVTVPHTTTSHVSQRVLSQASQLSVLRMQCFKVSSSDLAHDNLITVDFSAARTGIGHHTSRDVRS